MQVLHSAAQCQANTNINSSEALSSAWLDIYESVKNFVFVGLCDAKCVVSAAGTLSTYIFNSSIKEKVLEDSRMFGAVKLLYGGDSSNEDVKACQCVFELFLKDIFSCGSPYDVSVHNMLVQFSKQNSALYAGSVTLQKLAKEFASSTRH
jgi:hypothetical protein